MSVYRDKIALVTGGASGIGRAIGFALAAEGARVVLVDIRCEGLEATCQTIIKRGGLARWLKLDVSDRAAVQQVVDGVYATEGPIDYLFNNAGVCLFGEAREMTAAQWDRLIDVNIRGVVHGVEAVYPRMVDRGSGHIVNTASVVGLVPQPGSTAYSMTKHALVGMSQSLRGEAVQHGVRVSVVCPGVIDTDLKNTVDLLGLDREKLLALPSSTMMSAERCATRILRGVRWNRAVVQVTVETRLSWWLYRLAPGIFVNWLGPLWLRFLKARFSVADEA